jgi:hypothetical protein
MAKTFEEQFEFLTQKGISLGLELLKDIHYAELADKDKQIERAEHRVKWLESRMCSSCRAWADRYPQIQAALEGKVNDSR